MEMWQRFTSRARRAVLLAHSEATRYGTQFIRPEDLLRGLLRLGEGTALESIEQLGANLERLRTDLEQQLEAGRGPATNAEIAFTPEAQRVIQLAYAEARTLSDPYIGTEHLLLGLLCLGEGPAYRLLEIQGVKLEDARRVIAEATAARAAGRPLPRRTDAGSGGCAPTITPDRYARYRARRRDRWFRTGGVSPPARAGRGRGGPHQRRLL
jgi:ATP-dependent Clp protease ATP-binding subunit ClpA